MYLTNIINDTLKDESGKWSKQSLTFLVSFILTSAIGITILTLSFTMNVIINPVAENVFNSFMILTGVMSGTTTWNKIVELKNKKEE